MWSLLEISVLNLCYLDNHVVLTGKKKALIVNGVKCNHIEDSSLCMHCTFNLRAPPVAGLLITLCVCSSLMGFLSAWCLLL